PRFSPLSLHDALPISPPDGPDRAGSQKNCSGDLPRCCLLLRHGAGGGGESQRGTWHCSGSGRGIGGFAYAQFGSPAEGATSLSRSEEHTSELQSRVDL